MQFRRVTGPGRVVGIFTAPAASTPMVSHGIIECFAGVGLRGDRYALGTGLYSTKPHEDRHVTIIEDETLDALRRDHHIDLPAQLTRRNLVVRGIGLNRLVGGYLGIGEDVIVRVGRLNRPCRYWEQLIGLPVYEPTVHRSGINCQVLRGGTIRVGDALAEVEPVGPDSARHPGLN